MVVPIDEPLVNFQKPRHRVGLQGFRSGMVGSTDDLITGSTKMIAQGVAEGSGSSKKDMKF